MLISLSKSSQDHQDGQWLEHTSCEKRLRYFNLERRRLRDTYRSQQVSRQGLQTIQPCSSPKYLIEEWDTTVWTGYIHPEYNEELEQEPREVEVSLEVFKTWLDKAVGSLVWIQCCLSFEQEAGLHNLPRVFPTQMIGLYSSKAQVVHSAYVYKGNMFLKHYTAVV